jgi:N-acetylated-alpha-linked acidic dipeptidase
MIPRITVAVTAFAAAAFLYATSEEGRAMRGYSAASAARQRALEERFRALPEPDRIRGYLERMSAEPHAAGSPGSRAVAEYALRLFREWGFDARIETFEALLPYPTHRSLEMVAPVRFRARLIEPPIAEDEDSGDRQQLPAYAAYSAIGDVTAPVVYVNYGMPADYEQLGKLGVDVKGKIVIARYGRVWRGTKGLVAQERGAVGCLLYSDPREDGYFQGPPYPKGPFRPAESVQRGSVLDVPVYPGDPLTPGWASEAGAKRLPLGDAATILKIPVLPVSYADAAPILDRLEGQVVPEAWRGALPLTYMTGPGPAVVRLKVEFDWTSKELYNVIATLPGALNPDEWVLYGNHHDAWVNGAHDPGSGAAALLETARAVGELRRGGWRPKRTVVFALWDAEEFGLVGSTEWVEKHAGELDRRVVAYLNTDSNGAGAFRLGAAPVLEAVLREALEHVEHPESRTPLARIEQIAALGASSDHVAFYHRLGIPSVNASFSGSSAGGTYHSIYDSFRWYSRYQDPEFAYGRALSRAMGTLILRLSEAELLPFEYSSMVRAGVRWMDETRRLAGGKLDFEPMLAELRELREASERYEVELKEGAWARVEAAKLQAVNAALMRSERELAREPGLPGRTWYRHRLVAPGRYTGYSAETLPGVRAAIAERRMDGAAREVGAVVAALRGMRERVEEATRLLKALRNGDSTAPGEPRQPGPPAPSSPPSSTPPAGRL